MASLAASLLRPRILSNLKMRTCVWRRDRRNTWMGEVILGGDNNLVFVLVTQN